jgi:hypothetical protein
MGLALAAMTAAGATPAHTLGAQSRPTLALELPPDSLLTRRGPLVRATNMLAGERIRQLLLAGFPARFHFRVERWSEGRFFDKLEGAGEFDILAQYLPAEKMYQVTQVQDDRAFPLGKYAAVSDAERAIGRANIAPLSSRPSSRAQYYQASLLVEVLSEKDLDEVARWLQGDVGPGLTGRANPASVVSRGIRTLASRLLGGEKLEYETTSERFRTP